MSCYKANNCKKYKMNIGNPNDWENPCNHCPYNISDYEIGYNKAVDDFVEHITLPITTEEQISEIVEQLKKKTQIERSKSND